MAEELAGGRSDRPTAVPDGGGQRPDWRGEHLELEIGPVAHGGHCVARHEGRVVFVRHALPGEQVIARVTEDRGGAFCRADAVRILRAAPERVEPPCPAAGPGRCGGCDFQHVSADGQLRLKAAVVAETLERIGGLSGPLAHPPVTRLPAPDGAPDALLGWRTRTTYAPAVGGDLGLRAHRSHRVQPIGCCPIAVETVGSPAALARARELAPRDATGVELVEPDAVLAHRPAATGTRDGRGSRPGSARRRGRRPADRVELIAGPPRVRRDVLGRAFEVSAAGFWQVHPSAAEAFVRVVLEALAPRPGEHALDLYAGAGLFAAFLADAVGRNGRVLGIESDRRAVADAAANLAGLPQAQVRADSVAPATIQGMCDELGGVDIAVLDPPRSGAGEDNVAALIAAGPRAIAYVACDPASFARDVRAATQRGWALERVQAFDAFPMTHHIECVGLLRPSSAVVR